MGYDDESKVYRLYDQTTRKIILNRDVVFEESKFGFHHLTNDMIASENILQFTQPDAINEHAFQESLAHPDLASPNSEILTDGTLLGHDDSLDNSSAPPSPAHSSSKLLEPVIPPRPRRHTPANTTSIPVGRRYPIRLRAPSSKFKDFWTLASELLEEPVTFSDTVRQDGWRDAINSEVDSILRNQTWKIVDQSNGKTPITAKWIFKIKKGSSGKVYKLKAQLVARGFQQKVGIDYNDIFAPVVQWSTIRTIFALAAQNQWPLHQMDVVIAFLNGTVQEDIYMEIPEGFLGANDPSKVCKIHRALYGLKQASKAWYARIDAWLLSQGLTRSENDPNLYFSIIGDKRTILLLYVDDLLLTGDDPTEIHHIQEALKSEFEMTNLGLAHSSLGAEIEYKINGLFIHQKGYVQKLLEKFGLQTCNPTKLPMDPHDQLQKHTRMPRVDPLLYRSLVGSLIYLTNTMPDICFAVSNVSKYMDQPEEAHYQAAKHILRYLRGTLDYGLFMPAENNIELHTYADADWGRDLDTRRSVSGIIHKLGDSSIFWSSCMQSTVSLLTTEAEYRVLTYAAKDIIYFRRLLGELGLPQTSSTTLLSDNQSCIKLVNNPVLHSRTKHIGIQHHFIREVSKRGDI
jgi:hypothetical protein